MRVSKLLSLASVLAVAGACDLFYLPPPDVAYDEQRPLPEGYDLPDRIPEVVVDDDGYASLYGSVKNWLSLEYVDGASITTVGTNPADITGDTDAAGAFAIDVPLAGVFWAYADKPNYVKTYEYVRMPNADYEKTLYILSRDDFDNMAGTYGVVPNPDCGTVVVELKNLANQGLSGVADLALLGASYQGPYFLDDTGQPYDGLDYTSTSGRAVFFNVSDLGGTVASPGLVVQLTIDDPSYVVGTPAYLNIYADYITRGTIQAEANGVPPPPVDPVVVDFYTEIYPILQQEACAACHAAGGPAAGSGLYMDGPAENVYAALREGTARVNLQYPDQSLVLTKPLYEDPPNHPNASFPSVDHPDYLALLNWIEQGAPWGVEPPPDPVDPVDFSNDVYPRFQTYDAVNYPYGRGCADCHDAVQVQGGLDLTGGAGVVYQRLADQGLYDVNYPDQSKILRYPYCGPTNCIADGIEHPVQVFAATTDPDYTVVLQWVTLGAVYVGAPPPPVDDPILETNVDFFTNVMPRFARRGCTGCHDDGGAGGLSLTGTPQQVYDALANVAIDGDYEGSPLYTKANAYYDQVNHDGGKQIANQQDDFARYIGGWIYENTVFVDPGYRYADQHVAPFFVAQGCTGCHNANGQANYGDLRLDLAGQNLIDELNGVYDADGKVRLIANDPAGSLIVTKAWDNYPDVNHGGGKKQVYTYYREYNDIATWIYEGATRP